MLGLHLRALYILIDAVHWATPLACFNINHTVWGHHTHSDLSLSFPVSLSICCRTLDQGSNPHSKSPNHWLPLANFFPDLAFSLLTFLLHSPYITCYFPNTDLFLTPDAWNPPCPLPHPIQSFGFWEPRVLLCSASKLYSLLLTFLSAGITSVCHHIQLQNVFLP